MFAPTALESEQLFYSSISWILVLTFIAHELGLSLIKRIQGYEQGLLFGDLKGTILKFARARINLGVGENG